MNKFKVPIRNILFLYSYVWDRVDCQKFLNLAAHDNFTSADILAELFLLNLRSVLRQGLYKTYESQNDILSAIRGKIDYRTSFAKQTFIYGKLACDFDEFTENNLYNQILKFTLLKLYKSNDISLKYKSQLRQVMACFGQVNYREITRLDFCRLKFNRLNKYYRLIIKISELITCGQMLSDENGDYNFLDLVNNENDLNLIFELFVCNFYRRELPKNFSVHYQKELQLNLTGSSFHLLPKMKMDTFITSPNEDIIIDTKFYTDCLAENYDTHKLISGNIYQILTYLNHLNSGHHTRGILLYPLPYTNHRLNETFSAQIISNSKVYPATLQFFTLDLSQDWQSIKTQLLGLVSPSR